MFEFKGKSNFTSNLLPSRLKHLLLWNYPKFTLMCQISYSGLHD